MSVVYTTHEGALLTCAKHQPSKPSDSLLLTHKRKKWEKSSMSSSPLPSSSSSSAGPPLHPTATPRLTLGQLRHYWDSDPKPSLKTWYAPSNSQAEYTHSVNPNVF